MTKACHDGCAYGVAALSMGCRRCDHPREAHSGRNTHPCLSATKRIFRFVLGDKPCPCPGFV